MTTFALVLAALTTPAHAEPAYDDANRPPLAMALDLPCDGCKTDANLVVSPREEARRDQLVVYLVGTNNDADKFGLVIDAAAHAGFDALAVGWVNQQTFLDYCGDPGDADSGNACMDEYADHIRLGDAGEPEGGWQWTADLNVPAADGIEARVAELVSQMALHDGNWAQYLDDEGAVVWNKVVVAGFSQGAQHARRLAVTHETAGLVMVDGGQGVYLLDEDPGREDVTCLPFAGRQACSPVITGATPVDRWFGLYDATRVESELLTVAWEAAGMVGEDRNGDSVDQGGETGPVVYTQQCDGAGAVTHLAMSVEGWMPTTLDCNAAATYPENAGDYHLFPAFVKLFDRAGGTVDAPVPSSSSDAFDAGRPAPAADADLPGSAATTVGCDLTGSPAPSLAFFAPLALLGLRRSR